jgi:hypothetical protein
LDGVAYEIVDEDVRHAVRIIRHEVGGVGGEDHVAAVGADLRIPRQRVRLGAVRGNTHPHGGPEQPVADEDVVNAVGVACNEVGSFRLEGHIAAVGADETSVATPVGRGATCGHTDQFGRPGFAVADEDILASVGVS